MKEGLIALNCECSKCNERMGLYERKSAVLNGDFEWVCSTITSQNIYGRTPMILLTMRPSRLFVKIRCHAVASTRKRSAKNTLIAVSTFLLGFLNFKHPPVTCFIAIILPTTCSKGEKKKKRYNLIFSLSSFRSYPPDLRLTLPYAEAPSPEVVLRYTVDSIASLLLWYSFGQLYSAP
ncbi:hypothetical protein TNCV_2819431 [Trichonephila clavipes]|nr:hypothetical protein TNCV_2819431 [Trichonephila clavipes]